MSIEHTEIDFANIHPNDDELDYASNIIIWRIRNVKRNKIVHSLKKLDRCCKSESWYHTVQQLKFRGKDEIERIPCNISKKVFKNNYVSKRI